MSLENGFMKIRATYSRRTKIHGRAANYGRERIRIAPKISPRTIYRSRWHLRGEKRKQFIDGNVCSPQRAPLVRLLQLHPRVQAKPPIPPDVFRPTKKAILDQRRPAYADGRESTQYENDRSSFASLPASMRRDP